MKHTIPLFLLLFLALTTSSFSSQLQISNQGLIEGQDLYFTHKIDNYELNQKTVNLKYELYNDKKELLWNYSISSTIMSTLIVNKKIDESLKEGNYQLKATIDMEGIIHNDTIKFEVTKNNFSQRINKVPYLLAILSIILTVLAMIYLLYKPQKKEKL